MRFNSNAITMIHQRKFVTLLASIGVCMQCVVFAGEAAKPLPNIVHIMIDDLGWQDVASHKIDGKPVYETPNLDALTTEGSRFTQAYSPAPTCAPSRTAFLRGQYPANTGLYHVSGGNIPRANSNEDKLHSPFYNYGLNKDVPTIARTLKQVGYTTAHIGKWHATGKSEGYPYPTFIGFDFSFAESKQSLNKFYNDPDLWDRKNNKDFFFGSWARIHPDRLSDFATADPHDKFQLDEDERPFDKPLDLALGFMDKHKDQPFFLNYATYYVHGPIGTRDKKRLNLYLKKMGYDFPTDPGVINAGENGQSNPYYASMVDTVDWMIGEVVEYLKVTDDPRNPGHALIDNTYIVIDSDNGGWVGSPNEAITDNAPLRAGKSTTYEGGLRIPFIVVGPGVPQGAICDVPINLIDLYPTFMAMAGMRPDPSLELDGCNILPLFEGRAEKAYFADGTARDTIFWYYPAESHMSAVIRKGGWKLIKNFGAGMGNRTDAELFQIYNEDGSVNDLSEANNLATQDPERAKAMLAELTAFLETADVELPYRNLPAASAEEKEKAPKVQAIGSEADTVWAEFETEGKHELVDALFLYTLNPKLLDATKGQREEWFSIPVEIVDGRVEAIMPPGATHGTFVLRDSENFMIRSEPMPTYREKGNQFKGSNLLANGYAYKPGLFALIQYGKKAATSAGEGKSKNLNDTLKQAEKIYAMEKASDEEYCDVIRQLRRQIIDLGVEESKAEVLDRFATDSKFN